MVVIRVDERDAQRLKMYGTTYAKGLRNILDFREDQDKLLKKIENTVENVISKYASGGV